MNASLNKEWPRILFLGDTHGSLAHIAPALESYEKEYGVVDALVHLGDFELAEPLDRSLPEDLHSRFWWIPGNHDFDNPEHRAHLYESNLVDRCLHLKIVKIGGLRIAGLGGIFKGRVWRPPDAPYVRSRRGLLKVLPRRQPVPLYADQAIYPDDVDRLAAHRADVLVTHEAPSSHRHGFAVIDALALKMGVRLVVHGHHHVDYRATANQGATAIIGVGLRGVTDAEGIVVAPGAGQATDRTKRLAR